MTSDQSPDPELIAAVRAGDPDAFGPLYARHADAARRLARGLARDPADADDLVAEAFARLLDVLRAGGGPDLAFRAYLLTTVRNLFHDRTRRDRRVRVTDDLSTYDPGVPFEDPAVAGLERTLVARAFTRLPERWQTVLWHTQVEGESPATVAGLLGLTPNGVATLAYRARERLRQNYLREHVSSSPTDQCESTVDRLGAYVRSGLSRRDRASVDAHLSGCRRCQVLYLELGDVNARLGGLLAPALLGEFAATAYLGGGTTTGLLGPIWSGVRRVSRRRSTQAGAAGAVAAAAVALALVLTGNPTPEPEPDPPGGPDAAAPGDPGIDQPAEDGPTPGPEPGTVPSGAPGAAASPGPSPSPSPPPVPITMDVALEPVGALVRDRPGVLALAVAPAGGAGGELPVAQPPAGTGPLTAEISVPDGVGLREDAPGDGWSCTEAGADIRCRRPSLPAGATSRAYVPVAVSAGAAGGPPRVRLTGPGIEAVSATAPAGVSGDGLAARLAGVMPATVVAGGNALLSCPGLDPTCKPARAGRDAFGRTDNDDYLMTGYADRNAPAGAPLRGMVSGATIPVGGRVMWAGLYWAGSAAPPYSPTAHLHVPGSRGYAAVAATTVRRTDVLRWPAYQASAEVTGLVRGSAGGDWWVAVEAGGFDRGPARFGGWALVMVVEDGGPDRLVAVFDELTPLRDQQSFSAAGYGYPGEARIGFVGWEGDRGLTGDQLRLGGAPLGGADRDNLAGGRADGTGSGWNTFGTDVRVLSASFPAAGDHRPTLTATAGPDAWLLGALVMVTPAP